MPMKTTSYDYLYHKPWYCQIARVQLLTACFGQFAKW